ncbi:hypothetical protein [Algibacillus agarilyticus]|uniref:hypothetical protein n=1 Tax=Algibacillus agarilyticus TaxID=2234133 RepID=UPI000DD03610|nr:hypothetical protein [Algibacillus agarilyticus]
MNSSPLHLGVIAILLSLVGYFSILPSNDKAHDIKIPTIKNNHICRIDAIGCEIQVYINQNLKIENKHGEFSIETLYSDIKFHPLNTDCKNKSVVLWGHPSLTNEFMIQTSEHIKFLINGVDIVWASKDGN